MNMLGIAMGGGVRVGLEDNIWFDTQRSSLATNFDCLQRIHRIIDAAGNKIVSSGEMRVNLNLLPGYGEYGR